MTPSKPLVALHQVSRVYASGETEVKALDEVSLTLHQGEFVAIIGQSGSGKSTLMNILGCLDIPSHGTYTLLGHDVGSQSHDTLAALRRQTFGFVFQRYHLLANTSAEENVQIPALYAGVPKKERRQRARALLDKLGLLDRADHTPSQLSGGQQQRVAIARALMNDPHIILADEPTGALDSQSGEEVMALLKMLHSEGRTIILITHDKEVAAHAERVIRLQDGRIIEDSGRAAVKTHPATKTLDTTHTANLISETKEAVKTALRALQVNLFRTSLTLLGIVIGVAAVVTMMAVGNGSKQAVLESISSLGTNIVSINPGAPGMRPTGEIATLTMDDAQALTQLDNVLAVTGEKSASRTVRFGNKDVRTSIQGSHASFPIVQEWDLEDGVFFNERDVKGYAPVAVLGKTVVEALYQPGEDVIGTYVMVGNIPFEVIGILTSKGAAPWGRDQDDIVLAPITTVMMRIVGTQHLNGITLKVDDVNIISDTENAINETLLARHGGIEDFRVRNTASFLEMASATQNTLTILLGAVAAISLFVGGIGVMNIMLVSVTERTREIGIRMATGARMRDILIQFNTEAAVVCLIGGVIGVLLGITVGLILAFFGVEIAFSTAPAVLAFACAVMTGIVFGYLPARKAARLTPVDALSRE